MLNLDTHILVYVLSGGLTSDGLEILRGDEWSISGIVLWEISKLVQLGRIEMRLDDPDVVRTLSRIHTWPLTLEVCKATEDLDFRSDPAAEIAATSLVHGVPLATRGGTIRSSKRVPLAG